MKWDVCLSYSSFLWVVYVETQQKISQSDKDVVRDHILVFVTQVPPLLRYDCSLLVPHIWWLICIF